MGSKGGGTTVSSNTPPPEVLANYKDVTAQAKQVAATPLQQYQGNIVAGFTPEQQTAFNNINSAQGAYQPYFNNSQNLINQGTQGYTPTQFSQGAISQYESPYTQDVINSTMANINQNNAEQQSALQGNAIAKGAWGGDRADLARNDLARQQNLASGQTIAGLENQNYSQALGQFNAQNQLGLQSAALGDQTKLQGAGLQGAMGNYAQANQLGEANAQLGAGTLQQQLGQAQLNVPYQQFLQAQQYPFQTTQWLSAIDTGLGSNSGSTTTTQQPSSGGLFGFLNTGGAVKGYAAGGGIMSANYGLLGQDQGNQFGIPDISQSWVPTMGLPPTQSMGRPPAAEKQQSPSISDTIATGKGLYGIGQDLMPAAKSLGNGLEAFGGNLMGGSGLGASSAYGLNAAGFGNTAYDMLAASDAAAAAGTTAAASTAAASTAPEWLSAIMAFLKDGGAVKGYDKGGSVGYAAGGWEQQPLFDRPLYSPSDALSAEEAGILPPGNTIGGMPLSATANNKLAMAMSSPDFGTGMAPAQSLMQNYNPNMTPIPPTGVSGGTTSGDMAALSSAVPTANTSSQQGSIEKPQALTDLQTELADNTPEINKYETAAEGLGAGLAAGHHSSWQNWGEVLKAAAKDYGEQKEKVQEDSLKKIEIEKQAQQLAVEADRYNKALQLEQEKVDQGKYAPLTDANGHIIGMFDSKKGETIQPKNTGVDLDKVVMKSPGGNGQQTSFSNLLKDPSRTDADTLTGVSAREALTPNAQRDVDSLLHGNPVNNITTRGGARQAAIAAAQAVDPNYDPAQSSARQQAMKFYVGNGLGARTFTSLNTFADHAANAIDGYKALNTDAIKAGSTLKNYMIENATTDPRVAVLNNDLDTLVAERGKILNPSGQLTDAAKSEGNSLINSAMAQNKGIAVINSMAEKVLERAHETQNQYKHDVGLDSNSDYYDKNADSFISPSAREAFSHIGIPVKNFRGGGKDENFSNTGGISSFDPTNPIVQKNAAKIQRALQDGHSPEDIKKHLGIN